MHINYTATEGVKLLGSEDGAWMSDGIDNGLQALISGGFKESRTTEGNYTKAAQTWTEVPGASGGTISVTNDVITITQSAATTMYVHTPITCAIGEVYSVSAYVLASNTVANIGVSDDTSGGADRVGLATSNSDLGLFTATFTATQTTHYVSLITVTNDTEVKFKNEVEIREAEIITGAELVTNGGFATDTDWTKGTGWTIAAGVATHASGTSSGITQALSLVLGKTYQVTFDVTGMTTGQLVPYLATIAGTAVSVDGTYTRTYTISSLPSPAYLLFSASSIFDGSIDNVTTRLAIPDLSSVGQGLAVYGSLNKHVVNVNADTVSYSGFTSSNYLEQPYNSNLDFGTAGFTIQGWFKISSTTASVILSRGYYSGGWTGALFQVYIASSKVIGYVSDDAAVSADTITSTGTYVDNEHHHFALVNDATNLNLYIDGVVDATAVPLSNAIGTLTNIIATMRAGLNSTGVSPFQGELDTIKVDSTILTASQIKTIYNKEYELFKRDRKHTVIDTTYDLDISPESTSRSTEVKRQSNTSIGGSTETLFQRNDKMWDFTTGNIHYLDIKYIRNCLDSIANGQTFTFDAYGTTASPTDPKNSTYESNFYAENRSGTTQYFKVGAKIRES